MSGASNTIRTDHDRTARLRVGGLALSLFIAPWLVVAANTGDSVTKLNGGDDLTPAGDLALAAAHPTIAGWSNLAALLGALLLVPATIGLMRLLRDRAARLSLIGGVLMATGYVCYFALVFQGFTTSAMVAVSGPTAHDAAVLQAVLDEHKTVWVYIAFVVGNLAGTFLVALAMLRARITPRWAGFAVLAWPVLHLAGLPWFEVAGAVAQGAGMAAAATVLIRQHRSRGRDETQPYELLRK